MNSAQKLPNATKWTMEIVSEHLLFIQRDVSAGRVFFVRSALARRGLKSDVWRYWKRTFANNDDIMEQIQVIETTLEANLLESALKNELPAVLAKVTLCYHYNWSNKPKPATKRSSKLKNMTAGGIT